MSTYARLLEGYGLCLKTALACWHKGHNDMGDTWFYHARILMLKAEHYGNM